jgi:uncharacterized protein HemY
MPEAAACYNGGSGMGEWMFGFFKKRSATAAQAETEGALTALKKGDYTTALRLLLPLAKQGEAPAQ